MRGESGKRSLANDVDWREISYPYLDAETPLLDAVLQRAKTSGMRTVICDGDVIYHDAKFTRVDRDGARVFTPRQSISTTKR